MELVCDDFLAFEESLKAFRRLDDNIAHALNTTIPTASFSVKGIDPVANCLHLREQLNLAHKSREDAIKKCILKASYDVQTLRAQRDRDEDNIKLNKDLRRAQKTLRLMQNELNVEEVIRDRSNKLFQERCRSYYRP